MVHIHECGFEYLVFLSDGSVCFLETWFVAEVDMLPLESQVCRVLCALGKRVLLGMEVINILKGFVYWLLTLL
jgi:hypothetical protein